MRNQSKVPSLERIDVLASLSHKVDIRRLNEALQEFEASGAIDKDCCGRQTKRLFSRVADCTEQNVGLRAADDADSDG